MNLAEALQVIYSHPVLTCLFLIFWRTGPLVKFKGGEE